MEKSLPEISKMQRESVNKLVIKNCTVVNEGKIFSADVLIKDERIEKIAGSIEANDAKIIDATGLFLLPGLIDDQVHFREPGLTHKGDLYTEPRAAVAGGVTSFMEMPNTIPNTLTQELLSAKYQIAATNSLANYSFYMGVSNDNFEEVMRTDKKNVCGLKIFLGSSTGNMLVDNEKQLENIFSNTDMLIATHCEDENIIRKNLEEARKQYGDNPPASIHPVIRNAAACYSSSSSAIALAKKHGTRLHILHISTADEIELFDNKTPLLQKKITAEACVHHLWFDDRDYDRLGMKIKWNPAIKSVDDKKAIMKAVLDNHIDVIATDHAPHTLEEKSKSYFEAPSGGPLVQHVLVALLELYHGNKISIEKIVEKTSHAVADCFRVNERGYIREGYFADLVLVDLDNPWEVNISNIMYKCKWSPFENQVFKSKIRHTFVNGHHVYDDGKFNESIKGKQLTFFQ